MTPIGKFFIGIVLLLCITQLQAQNQYAWTERNSLPAVGRHRAVGCSVGDRGYLGLGHINNFSTSINYADWWEYDPGTDSWMQKANFPPGGRYHAIAFSVGNFAYVGTGSDWGGDHDDMWKYSPATNTWTAIAPCPGGPRSGAVAFTIAGKGYVALGDFQTDCWEYKPSNNTWTAKPGALAGGYSSVVAVMNGKAYMGIGQSTAWQEFNPLTSAWTIKANFPGAFRFGSGCFAYNGWVYVVSGSDWGTEYTDSYAYNPATDQWVQVADFPGQGRHYFTCFTIGTKAYGGTGTSGTNFNDFWEFGMISGIENQIEENAVSVFPNPVIDKAEFVFGNELKGNGIFTLTDLEGKKIREELIPASDYWIFDRYDLAAGTYFYSIVSEKKSIANGKLILQ